MLRPALQLILLALLVVSAAGLGASLIGSSKPPRPEINQPRNQEPQWGVNYEDEDGKSFGEWLTVIWDRTLRDPVAFFTLWLAIFSFGLLVVAGLQIWLLLRAENVATRSANAAQNSAEIAERALIAGDRAFVSPVYNRYANRSIKDGQINSWAFSVTWHNAGNTPTRNMVNHISIMLREEELPDDWDFPDRWSPHTPEEKRHAVPLGIAPKATIESERVYASVADVEDVINEKKILYLWGWAAYNDVFPNTERYVTRFAVRVFIGGDARDPERISFRFSLLSRYNCSDEECRYQGYPVDWNPRNIAD